MGVRYKAPTFMICGLLVDLFLLLSFEFAVDVS